MADEMTSVQLRQVADLIYAKTGIFLAENREYYLRRRLAQRIAATDHQNLESYYKYLRFGDQGEELQALIEAVTVHETYFYREFEQLKIFGESVLPLLVKENSGLLRLWSAGCSTGEEAYTLAMILREMLSPQDFSRWEILATDISHRVLAFARTGLYNERAVSHLPQLYRERYFHRENHQYRVKEELRRPIRFKNLNLMDRIGIMKEGPFDVIFCRNVLIYFDEHSREQVVRSLYDALRPGGYIFLGHSETMSRITSLFIMRKFREFIVYQKPVG